MNDTGGEKSCLNRASNPGSLAYHASTLTTELSRHTDQPLLNDNSPKHIYTLSIICASFADPVFFRVFRSVYNYIYIPIHFVSL